MQNTRPKRQPLSVHDPVLGPVLRSATATSASRVALAVTCRGLSAGISPSTIRLWLSVRDPERCATITATPRTFFSVEKAARRHVERQRDLSRRRERGSALAAVLVGLLLAPVPVVRGVSDHQAAAARRALAVVGVEILKSHRDQGWDTALVHAPRLAVQLGVTPVTARRLLRTCVDAGWLICPAKKSGGGARYRLTKRISADARAVSWEAYDTVQALTDGVLGVDDAADLIALADHPAWSYDDERGTKVWLTALADAAQVDVTDLGVAQRSVKPLTKAWIGMLMEHPTDAPLVTILDADAAASGAVARAAEAETQRDLKAAARVVEVTAARAAGEWARSWLDVVVARHPVPAPTASREDRGAWLVAMQAAVAQTGELDDRARRALTKALGSRMQSPRHGYDAEIAKRVATKVVQQSS